MLRCCFNPKVIGALLAVAGAVYLLSPGGAASALPILIALLCPLSMVLMMLTMRRGGSSCSSPRTSDDVAGRERDEQLRALREELAIAKAQHYLARRDKHVD